MSTPAAVAQRALDDAQTAALVGEDLDMLRILLSALAPIMHPGEFGPRNAGRGCGRITDMRFAYADPPYIGQAKRHYSHDPRCAEVDHVALVRKLFTEFPDGWALSCSSPSLGEILGNIQAVRVELEILKDERIAVWCKSFCAIKRNVRPAYAWEPVIFWGGRNPMNGHRAAIPEKNGKQTTPKDFIVEPITSRRACRSQAREGLPMDSRSFEFSS